MKDQNLLLTTLSKYINLDINHNLTLKLKKILLPITQGSQIQDTFIKHIMYQIIEKSRHTKFIHDLDIPKDEHINLWLKTFTLTLELNPQSQVYHILFTAHFSSICLICKIQMSYLNTSNVHEILQSHSSGCLINTISISESNHKTMNY